jgi:sulfonate transport system substrate-binding protein
MMQLRLSRRTVLAGLGVLPIIGPARAETSLRVGDQKGGAKALMEAAGQLEGLPYRLDWSLFAGAPMLLEAMNAGAIDTGVVGDAPFVFAAAADAPIKGIAALRQDQTGTAVVVPDKSPIRTVADLKGKTIGTLRGQTGHFLVLAALKQAGLQFTDVKFAFLDPVSAKSALFSGSIDAWATWGPYIATARINDGARVIVTGHELMSGYSYQVATDQAIAAKRPLLADYLRRLTLARRWGLEHMGEQARIWAEQTGFPLAVAQDVIETAHAEPVPIDDATTAGQQRVADFFHEAGVIAKPEAVAPFFDRSFNDDAFRA